jgi:hypothetical protein
MFMQNFSSQRFYPAGLRQIFKDFSEKLLSEFQKSLSIQFSTEPSKVCSCKISESTMSPRNVKEISPTFQPYYNFFSSENDGNR